MNISNIIKSQENEKIEEYLAIRNKIIEVKDIPSWSELENLLNYYKDTGEEKDTYFAKNWFLFCHKENIFQAFSYEFIEILAKEIKELSINGKIVELCAGNGKLSYWLKKFDVFSIAVDDYSLNGLKRDSNYVEELTHIEALHKYKPELVIGCWIPYKSKVALDVLDLKCVKYYIDIGEGCGGCTGVDELWNTKDFALKRLKELEKFSLCRADYDLENKHSFTVLFERLFS